MASNSLAERLAPEFGRQPGVIARTLALFDEGATLPFVVRYRKEVTGGMDETEVRRLIERSAVERRIDERRDEVHRLMSQQGVLTAALIHSLEQARDLSTLEDLYLPYRPKRRTRAQVARDLGLQPLADLILAENPAVRDLDQLAVRYVDPDRGIADKNAAWSFARDIAAEEMVENAVLRARARDLMRRHGRIGAKRRKDADAEGRYATYHEYSLSIDRVPPHAVLALNRGESEEVLRVSVDINSERMIEELARGSIRGNTLLSKEKLSALADGVTRLLLPAIEREIRAELTEKAEIRAAETFAENLRSLLLAAPLRQKTVLGIDPGFRTGCKLAVVDPLGRVIETGVLSLFDEERFRLSLQGWLTRHRVDVIAIGNGTASRETEALVADVLRNFSGTNKPFYTLVNEAGASVYSASEAAREEAPELDVSERGTVSIARRIQDPLAELVKIPPESLGIGLYQHDLDAKHLALRLNDVVSSCVNHVGVDLNTASAKLLEHVAGLQAKTARAIVAHRTRLGAFRSRRELNDVKGIGPRAFEQAAGFLRIESGEDTLDATAVHPESYAGARKILNRYGKTSPSRAEMSEAAQKILSDIEGGRKQIEDLARECELGVPTLRDVLHAMAQPGRDPRDDGPPPILRSDILKLEDLSPGLELQGTVRNVVDFGAFVDIGVKDDGLIHVSAMGLPRGGHPIDRMKAGDIVTVCVESIDRVRRRIALRLLS